MFVRDYGLVTQAIYELRVEEGTTYQLVLLNFAIYR